MFFYYYYIFFNSTESGDLILPRNVDVTDYSIDSAGNVDELIRHASNVKELILYGNYIQDWDEVCIYILQRLAGLRLK